ncbi:uncharacterized protein LOC130424665 [Triplophysa dalaica]|uniref:uncharacterized protein LOC130424665 n=1 Tax=Triplophysa dalaica TaxID=1582913 RepID=UPI0024DFD14C|nr:uncharacterized protein LOC130424665 [Triplophysa dalaica]
MALRHLSTEDLITELFHFGIEVTEEERSKFKDNAVDGEAVDYGLTERIVSYLFEGSFKKQAKFNRFAQQWKETVTLTLEPVPVHSEKATPESSHAIPSSAFPAAFIIPKFPRDVQTKLDQKPPCKMERSDHNKIIRTLYETMALIKMFLTNDDYVKVCKALILKYPFLKDKEGNGYFIPCIYSLISLFCFWSGRMKLSVGQ